MTTGENLLITFSEECAEIQQAVAKGLRFGLDNHHPDHPDETNEADILTEFYQLQAVMDLLQETGTLKRLDEATIVGIKVAKWEKMRHYMAVSRECGRLKD